MNRILAIPLYLFILCYLLAQAGFFLYRKITTQLARRHTIKEYGCEPPNSFDDKSRFPYLFRLKMIKAIRSAAKDNRLLKSTQEKYQAYGNTHSAKVKLYPESS